MDLSRLGVCLKRNKQREEVDYQVTNLHVKEQVTEYNGRTEISHHFPARLCLAMQSRRENKCRSIVEINRAMFREISQYKQCGFICL